MINHKLKKIKLIILSLLILTILIISIGLSLIGFYNLQDNIKYIPCYYNYHTKQEIIIQKNGFTLLKEYGFNFVEK
ncbi:hypothetical protein [Spiroplasma endosymbiont of Amphimallon solstitiale]|uniref:hypothetical protein n=1 Tax=Spiroplasma endosymbiont of Amphimallon solstitiale TaxID=3066288 RepID=UPI00313C35F3